jgi:hypothetical protein
LLTRTIIGAALKTRKTFIGLEGPRDRQFLRRGPAAIGTSGGREPSRAGRRLAASTPPRRCLITVKAQTRRRLIIGASVGCPANVDPQFR